MRGFITEAKSTHNTRATKKLTQKIHGEHHANQIAKTIKEASSSRK